MARRIEDRPWKDQSIGSDDRDLRLEPCKGQLFGLVAKSPRAPNLEAELAGADFNRGWSFRPPAAGWAGRLGVDARQLVAGMGQRIERRNREVRASHEDDPH